MIKAVTCCIVSAAVGAAAVAVTLSAGIDERTADVAWRWLPGARDATDDTGAAAASGSANRDSERVAGARVAATLPAGGDGDPPVNVADQLVSLAATDPREALRAALALGGYWHRLDTVDRIVTVWARREPAQALNYVQESFRFDPVIERRLLASVFEQWAASEPDNVLNFLLTQRGQRQLFDERSLGTEVLRELAVSRADELLGAAGNLPRGPIRSSMRTAAIESLVERDLELAVRQATSEASTMDRTQWTLAIAEYLTQQVPARALEQATELDREFPGMLTDVAFRLAITYPATVQTLNLCEFLTDLIPDCSLQN